VGLADRGPAQEKGVAALFDEAQRRELGDDRPVDRALEVELELAEAFVERVVGAAQPLRYQPRVRRLDPGPEKPRAHASSTARRSDAVASPRYAKCSCRRA
jgi:hypothetical protein